MKLPFKRLEKYLLILPFFALPFVYNNCAPANFASDSSASVDKTDIPVMPTPPPGVTKTFETDVVFSQLTRLPLDLVWVVDNSNSMSVEASHVRNNFSSFISNVQSKSDVKVALISKIGTGGQSVSIPLKGPNFLEIDQEVDSFNGPLKVSEALCTSAISTACKASGVSLSSRISGKLSTFLRPNSKKAFIFVTDDNSSFSEVNLDRVIDAAYPGQRVTHFGFIGLGKADSPCQYKTGVVYQSLAANSGGAVFNICDQDWSQTFATLADNVSKLVTHAFPVPAEIRTSTILSVSINGVALKAGQFSLSAGQIQIAAEVAEQYTSGRIKIVYQTR